MNLSLTPRSSHQYALVKRRKLSCVLTAALTLSACGSGSSSSIYCDFIGLGQTTSKLSTTAVAGAAISITPFTLIAPSGCSAAYTAANLPNGLAINNSTSQISGSVATAGTYGFTVTLNVSPISSLSGGSTNGYLERPVELIVTK